MFTVIFPTMWKFEPFFDFLKELVNHYLVGEVIVIDNNSPYRPSLDVLNHEKIKLLDFKRNTYVNGAWNAGVKNSKFDNLCICNDDVIFDLRIFSKVEEQLTNECGIIGISVLPWEQHITDGMIRIKNYEKGDGQWGFSLCFFMKKEKYEPIPESLKLFFGDNFVYDNCLWRNLPIKIIKDVWFYTPNSVTIKLLPEQELINLNVDDALAYKQILVSKGIIDPYKWSPSIKMILEKFAPHLV